MGGGKKKQKLRVPAGTETGRGFGNFRELRAKEWEEVQETNKK